MTTQTAHTWERVGSKRYATEYLGHSLQAIRNPGFPGEDQRPYIAVVDRKPLDQPSWSLADAKTKAIRHVINQLGKPAAKPRERPVDFMFVGPDKATLVEAKCPHAAAVEALFDDVPPLAPPSDEAMARTVAEHHLAETGRTCTSVSIEATITDPNTLSALNTLKETLSLMREVADVRCVVNLPPCLEL
jgi:hypothetical protein